jgi:hypothetical protein
LPHALEPFGHLCALCFCRFAGLRGFRVFASSFRSAMARGFSVCTQAGNLFTFSGELLLDTP